VLSWAGDTSALSRTKWASKLKRLFTLCVTRDESDSYLGSHTPVQKRNRTIASQIQSKLLGRGRLYHSIIDQLKRVERFIHSISLLHLRVYLTNKPIYQMTIGIVLKKQYTLVPILMFYLIYIHTHTHTHICVNQLLWHVWMYVPYIL